MTLTSLFGAGPSAREPPSMADNLGDYYGIDRGGHGWKSKSEMKKTKSTLSALTLLAFLFFLNLLLTCLKDTLQGNDPEIIVVPQQRVTRRVSGQLVGIMDPMGDTGVAPPPPVLSPILSPTLIGGDEKSGGDNAGAGDDDNTRTKKTRRSVPEDEMSVETVHDAARRAKKLDADYETSLETPETLRDGVDKDYDYGTLGPLDYTGVEPESLGWETVDDVRTTDGKKHRASDIEGDSVGLEPGSEEGSGVESKTEDALNDNEEGVREEKQDGATNTTSADTQVAVTSPPPDSAVWEVVRAVLEGLGRRVGGKGWQESLASLQHPGMGLFHVGEQVMNYAMPILRETSTKFGFDPARCKELVICETSRLAWMWGDKDVTSAFNGVFEWLYGMEEPELRTINREWRKKKKSCRNYIKRCQSEAGDDSWLPMIANVLEYFVT